MQWQAEMSHALPRSHQQEKVKGDTNQRLADRERKIGARRGMGQRSRVFPYLRILQIFLKTEKEKEEGDSYDERQI